MRDLLEDISEGEPPDPVEATRRAMRLPQRRRFYEQADVSACTEGFAVLLDGKPTRTPASRLLAAPSCELAQAMAAEWNAQGEFIEFARMPLTRLANTIIDGIVNAPQPVADEIAKYLATDLVLYRAAEPAGLVARQAQHWDPVLAWAAEALGVRFALAEGVIFVPQPESALAAARAAIPGDAWRTAALHSVTTLTGSALLALALAADQISVDAAWTAAHVDEDWNMEQWGRDAPALERRAFRFAELQAAATVLRLLG
ncbi:MAG: ATP12 family chaperone protein [Xanthobacteraceae bacterium]